jgi:hypothetical protein
MVLPEQIVGLSFIMRDNPTEYPLSSHFRFFTDNPNRVALVFSYANIKSEGT